LRVVAEPRRSRGRDRRQDADKYRNHVMLLRIYRRALPSRADPRPGAGHRALTPRITAGSGVNREGRQRDVLAHDDDAPWSAMSLSVAS
jgi:hypothetical protein